MQRQTEFEFLSLAALCLIFADICSIADISIACDIYSKYVLVLSRRLAHSSAAELHGEVGWGGGGGGVDF